MPLQFITGNSGSGKSTQAYQELIRRSMEHPEINYIVLVPEQFTMQTQKELVRLHPAHGIFNIDILSFQRLAYRIFEETGGSPYPLLEETGKSLVLERVAQEQKKNLKVLAQSLRKPGTVSSMKSLVSELKQYCITPDMVGDWVEQKKKQPLLAAKLSDVQVIYQAFEDYLAERYVTAEDVLSVLAARVPESALLANAELLLDGFTGFTPVQIRVIEALLMTCRKVEVTVILDEREDLYAPYHAHQLFAMSRALARQLVQAAKAAHSEILPVRTVYRSGKGRFAENPAMDFLEQNLFRFSAGKWEGKQEAIRIHRMSSPREELEYAALMIRRKVREEGMRYRDFAVLCGDLAAYGNLAEEVFRRARIPVFIDEKRSVLANPLSELIRAACELVVSGYSYESVFRYLRCGFSNLAREEIDLLENYCLALGIRGYETYQEGWTRHSKTIAADQLPEINQLRQRLMEETGDFYEKFHHREATVLDRTRALYELIAGLEIQEKLEAMADRFEEEGRKDEAREYRQIYGIVMNLLEKLSEVLGEEILHYNEYQQILEAGLAECSVGVIPPVTDQVLVGDNERTRLKDIQVLFFTGVNDNLIPKRSGTGGILSEHDREELGQEEIVLSPDSRTEMYMQRFHLYRNLTRPARELHLSYAVTGSAGESLGPSYLIRLIQDLFPEMETETIGEDEDILWRVETSASGIPELLKGLSQAVQGEISPEFLELFRYYEGHPETGVPTALYLDAAFLTRPGGQIGEAAAHALYGNRIEGSPTLLEKYAACAFAHFLQYGLKLKERDQYEFKSSDLGTILHNALEKFAGKLIERHLDWKNLRDEETDALIDESLSELLPDYGNTILEQSSRNRYQKERIRRLMARTVWALTRQIREGDFVPGGLEVSFERREAIHIPLSGTDMLRLGGRIDRVDLCETDDHVYVKIIDYKTGNTSLDLLAFYYGLQLQLLVYLDGALSREEKKHPDKRVEPAGIFYYHIGDPIIETDGEASGEEVEREILTKLRPSGLVNSDSEILSHLDHSLAPGVKSSVIPVGMTRTGALDRTSRTASSGDMEVLRRFARWKAAELGNEILGGDVQIAPSLNGKKTACTYCGFKGICGFDRRIPGYEYRELKEISSDALLAEMQRKMGMQSFEGEGGKE